MIGKHAVSLPVAQWVIDHGQIAGSNTNTLPNACAVFFPLLGSNACLGCVAIRSSEDNMRLLEPDQKQLLEACAGQLALALERDRLASPKYFNRHDCNEPQSNESGIRIFDSYPHCKEFARCPR